MNSWANEEEDEHRQYAMQLASASVLPMELRGAIELGVLDIIEKAGPDAHISASQILSQLPLAEDNPNAPLLLDRILCLLSTHSILTCSPHKHTNVHLYGLAPVSKYFIPNQDGVSLAPLFQLIQDKTMVNMWYHMKDSVMEGQLPFNRAYGMSASEYISKDGTHLQGLFKNSMRDYNLMFMTRVLETYKGFEGIRSIVDVGGGDGTILNIIVSKYPTIKEAINFDLPPIIENSPAYSGVEYVAGNMFESIPKGEVIFMKWMLHSWDDENCMKILRNCYEALPEKGKVIVVELVIPEAPETSVSVKSTLQFDLFMMNMNPAGKERTEREFETLGKETGFTRVYVACSAFNFSLVEFYKEN